MAITVTVPKSYAFTVPLRRSDTYSARPAGEERTDTEWNYNVVISDAPNGDFHVTGEELDVESYVDDICIGDPDSVDAIMDTAV